MGKMEKMAGMMGMAVAAILLLAAGMAQADTVTFGSGTNAFNIDFVPISKANNPSTGYGIVTNDYRMGTYEITNDQWTKFKAAYGAVTGTPSSAYDQIPYFTGDSVPTNEVSWYEAAQFVNYLNTITNNHVAYNFTGTIHTSDYVLSTWSAAEADNGTNLYRHKDAKYYLPTEDEWVKAAYWNGTTSTLQTYATKAGESLTQGNGTSGTGWNYYNNGYATNPAGPWNVGSGSEELNGTRDMMGNVWEWMESPYSDTGYGTGSNRGLRGGSYIANATTLASSYRYIGNPYSESTNIGFRVASEVPEPASLGLITLGGLALLKRRRR
jgi:formylglycine-generating enzyme required for sulfatase activity